MFTHDKYQKRCGKIRDELGINPQHRAHDGRVHFVTMAKKYSVDEYTKREIEWLKTEIEKIK